MTGLIRDEALSPSQIPASGSAWPEIAKFALTFKGYDHWGSLERCAEIARAKRHETLAELRTCLFFEQRSWRHVGEDPDHDDMKYIHGLIEQIRAKVAGRHAQPLL